MPRRVSQQSNGLGTAPRAFCANFSFSYRSPRFMMSAPPKRSAWPPRYFVVLWTTRSTPRPKGFCNAGDAKVLSHTLTARSEEHTSELQSHSDLVCRLLL